MIFGAILGAATSLIGANKQAKAADKDRALQQAAMDRLAEVEFNPWNVNMPGGTGATFQNGQFQGQLGQFDPMNQLFQQFAPSFYGQGAGIMGQANQTMGGLPQNEAIANQLAAMSGGQAANYMMGGSPLAGVGQNFLGQVGGFDQTAMQQLMGGQQMMGLGGSIMGAANPFAAMANDFTQRSGQSFDDLRANELSLLRQQAAPQEEQQLSTLQDQLFGMGRMGTTGGSKDMEAFARGLGQADLGRQLAATQTARQLQQQQGNLANIFGGLANQTRGTGLQAFGLNPAFASAASGLFSQGTQRGDLGQRITGLESDLMTAAFDRFGATSGLAADLNQALFNRGGSTAGFGLEAMGGMGTLQDMLMNLGKFGADLGAQQATTDIQAAGGQGQIANQLGPTGGELWGQFASGIDSDALAGSLKDIWSKIGKKSSSSDSGPYNG